MTTVGPLHYLAEYFRRSMDPDLPWEPDVDADIAPIRAESICIV